jgi:N-methylhydantoinase B
VADDYVSIERAAKDYGIVLTVVDAEICAYAVDETATKATREAIRRQRSRWLATDPEEVAAGYRAGEIDRLDVVRRYAVVLDWDTGALLPVSTGQFREMFHKRTAATWARSGSAETPASSDA